MKIESIGVVPVSQVPPKPPRMRSVTREIIERLKSLPSGQALAIKVSNANPRVRYSLERRLKQNGFRNAQVTQRENTIFIRV